MEPLLKIGFQLGETDDSNVDGYVRWFESEEELLNEWNDFVVATDPDFMESFNGTQFDFPYLVKRMEQFNIRPLFDRMFVIIVDMFMT